MMHDPDLDWFEWIDYRDDLPTPDDNNNPVLSTGHNAKEATMIGLNSLNDYHEMNSYGRMLLRECADSARYFDKCQDEAAEFQAEQDALALKRDYMVQKHAAADLRMKYAFEAYNQHLYAWKLANSFGHDYRSSDHCAICGAEEYEGDAYYGGCTPATPICEHCNAEVTYTRDYCCPWAIRTEVSE